MLEAPQATHETTDALADLAKAREKRKRTRERLRHGHSDEVIDQLDLRETENTASTDGAFAAALERAIEAGTERDIGETLTEECERPPCMIVPRVHLPEQIPAIPQPLLGIAESLSEQRQAQIAEDRDAIRAEPVPPATRGALTLFDLLPGLCTLTVYDLRVGRCRYSSSESAPYFFCGAPTGADNRSWCPDHHLVCFPPRS